MQVEPKSNYNVLGRMGPLHPRPEYRPKTADEGEGLKSGGERDAQSRKRAAERPAAAAAAQAVPEGRLSLQAAKALTAAAAEAIAGLDPLAVKGPHYALGRGAALMWPRYV
jgi:hypothetical protein